MHLHRKHRHAALLLLFLPTLCGCGSSQGIAFLNPSSLPKATQLTFAVQPSRVIAGKSIAPSVRVECRDALGNLVNAQVRMTLTNAPGDARLAGSTTMNTSNGIATFADLSVSRPGAGFRLAATSDTGVSATSASFAVTPSGFVVMDLQNNRAVQFDDLNGTNWTTLALPASPLSSARDTVGKLYIGGDDGRIRRFDDISGANPTVYNIGGASGSLPGGLVLDSLGRLLFTDANESNVVRIDDLAGTNRISLGTSGSGVNQFDEPAGLAMDGQSRIYVVDDLNARIVRIDDLSGANWVTFGTSGTGVNQFRGPAGIALDAAGRIYVADRVNNRIVRFDDMTGSNWVTFGTAGNGVNQFTRPVGVDIGSSGQIYVADTDNNRIVRFDDMTGANWTSFGSLGSGQNQFNRPRMVDAP